MRAAEHIAPHSISIVGHSNGGLVARYAIGKLESAGFFSSCCAETFVAVASPLLGARRMDSGQSVNYLLFILRSSKPLH